MKKQIIKISTAAATTVTYLSFAGSAFAQEIDVCAFPDNESFAGLCEITSADIGPVISSVVTILLIAAALIALFFLILGGIRWITSGGDKSKVESARNTIIAAIIGLIIALLAFFITTIVLGLFGISLTELTLPSIVGGNNAGFGPAN